MTIIGCPKLDSCGLQRKADRDHPRATISQSVTVRAHGGALLRRAGARRHQLHLQNSGKFIPWNVVTFSTDGRILDR